MLVRAIGSQYCDGKNERHRSPSFSAPPWLPDRQLSTSCEWANSQGRWSPATNLVYDRLPLKQLLVAIIHISGEELDILGILLLMIHSPQRNDISIQYCLIQSWGNAHNAGYIYQPWSVDCKASQLLILIMELCLSGLCKGLSGNMIAW